MDKLDKKIFKWFILQILWITSLNLSLVSSHDTNLNFITELCLNPPKLIPSDTEVTLDHQMTYTVKCTADSAVFWDKPYPDYKTYDWAVKEVYEEDGSYSSVLILKNVFNIHVGNYMCRYKKYKYVNIEDQIGLNWIASIYIFVKDPYPIVKNFNYVIIAEQYSNIVIPCKPTNREVNLTLQTINATILNKELIFDPKIGFTVTAINFMDRGWYSCSAPETGENELFLLMVLDSTNVIKRPVIEAPNNAYAKLGKEYVLNCIVNIKQGVSWEAIWTGPDKQNISNNEHYIIDSYVEGISRLTIRNVTGGRDNGIFKCEIINNFSHETSYALKLIIIPEYSSVNLTVKNDKFKFEVNLPHSEPMQFEATHKSCPISVSFNNVEWYNNRNQLIDFNLSNKYNITIMNDLVILTIINVAIEDAGNYTLKAIFGKTETEVTFELVVCTVPTVSFVEGKRMVDFHSKENVFFKCQAVGFPPSIIFWSFTKCSTHPVWPSCSLDRTNGTATPKLNSETNTQIMEINFNTPDPGILECYAANSINSSSVKTEILISDLQSSEIFWEIQGLGTRKIAVGESVTLTCSALAYNYTSNLIWYRGSLPIKETENLFISTNTTPYSFQKILTWNTIGKVDAGVYECHTTPIDGGAPKKMQITVNVYDPIPPKLIQIENKMIEKEYLLGELLRHECYFDGIPEPNIRWLKDGDLLQNNSRVHFTNDNSVLEITRIALNDDGVYTCEGFNKMGSDSAQLTVKIIDKLTPAVEKSWIIGAVIVILMFIICTTILTLKILQSRKRLRELKIAGVAYFEKGCIESLNPAISLDEQADLLPYNKKYEFPHERLKLGKQLDSGAFGVVMKAEAVGIMAFEDSTTVAVKTMKTNTDNEALRALILELKIMIHMGKHLNVVNLLGAVTRNIAKRELFVIVEYCRYGNIQHYLQHHRSSFVNQINPETDEIDWTIGTAVHDESHLSKNYSGVEYNSCSAETIRISSGKQVVCLTNNLDDPAKDSNDKMDENRPTTTITTSDLVCWGFQVARGMDYLSSRKVLHGDLAARNILLCDDNVVKICDFGMSRSMYKSDNYKKTRESPLPFKWLALESISDQVFSTYSDVWAFGIVMWEIFSLAKTPYPGIKADQSLYMKLRDGYRMEKPNYANQELYELMLNCWCVRPDSRPLFGQIQERLGKMLQLSVMEHYIDLNEPYIQVNAKLFSNFKNVYYEIMDIPLVRAPSIPIVSKISDVSKLKHADTELQNQNRRETSL